MNRIAAIFISVLIAVGPAFHPVQAQQIIPQWPGGPQIIPQWPGGPQPFWSPGDGLTPRLPGVQPPGPPQINPQGQFFYPQGPQAQQPSDLSQASQRYCGWVAIPQPPSAPPRQETPRSPQTVPVQQSPWPGAPTPPEADRLQPVGVRGGSGQGETDQSTSKGLSPERQPAQAPAGQIPTPGPYPVPFFYEPLSTIEEAFNRVPSFNEGLRKDLRQYGYSLFASPVSTFAPITDVPVGPDYILGPGDDLAINIWGAMESGGVRTVDRNGQIILPTSGPLRVWGLSFSQAERLIRDQLSRSYPGFQTNVTMGRLRTIRVYVVGEVCQPGSFTISSLATVTNALFAAGGPLKLGSLRNVQLKRNHHDVGTLDLYDFLLRGDKTSDFRLESGDTIFVPPVGPVAAVEGEIKRPGIYELKGTTKVSDLIEMAGGVMPQSYLKRVQLIRSRPSAEREVIDIDLTDNAGNGDSPKDTVVQNGDLVRIYPTDPRIYNTVTLVGAVKHPGEYELKRGMRLSQLLRHEAILPEAFMDRVEIARLKEDLTTEVLQIDLRQAWEADPKHDISLKPRDQITVRTGYRTPWKVTLGGEVKRPGVYTIQQGERLSSALKRAGGFTDKAFPKGAVFTRVTVQEVEKKRLDDFVRDQEQRLLAVAIQEPAQQPMLTQGREQLKLLASKVTLGRVVIHLDDLEKFEGSSKDLILEDGDGLTVPQKPATVLVMGSVRHPTGVLHQEDMDAQYYLNRAGGLTPEADAKGIYMLKADGSAITGFVKLRQIEPGDVIIVPPSTEAKVQWLPLLKDLATIAGQVALGLAGLAAIF